MTTENQNNGTNTEGGDNTNTEGGTGSKPSSNEGGGAQFTTKPAAVQFESTGMAGLDLALSFVAERGVLADDPALKAAESGDLGPLKAKLATMGDAAKGWEQVLAVGESDFKRMQDSAKEANAKAEAQFAEYAGGAEQWTAIKEWAKAKAEPAEKAAINAALKAGGIAAKAMVVYLNGVYNNDPSVSVPPNRKAVPGNAGSGNSGQESYALSPRAYVEEVQKLRAKVRGNVEDSPEYAKLQARRQAWRG